MVAFAACSLEESSRGQIQNEICAKGDKSLLGTILVIVP